MSFEDERILFYAKEFIFWGKVMFTAIVFGSFASLAFKAASKWYFKYFTKE